MKTMIRLWLCMLMAMSCSVYAKKTSMDDRSFKSLRVQFINQVILSASELEQGGVDRRFLQVFTYKMKKWTLIDMNYDHYPELIQFKSDMERFMEHNIFVDSVITSAKEIHQELFLRIRHIHQHSPIITQ